MATIEELLSANLPVVPSLPFRTAQPTTKAEIQAARAELEPYQRAGESGRQQSQMIAEALRTRQRQIGEQAASAREKGLLEIEAKRPIPKELPAFDAPKKTFDELFSVIMVGAMTAAGAGKGNYLAAANSMIGAMEGYQKGKKTEFDQALREFDTSLKKALQEEKVNNAKYQQIAASDKLSLAEKVRQIQIQATALDDKIMSATARSNDFEKMTREIARRNEGFAKIEDARNKAEEELKRDRQRAADRASLAAATREAGRLAGRTAQTWEVTDEQGKKRNISVMPQYDRQGRQTNEPAGGVLLGTGARAGATGTPGGAVQFRYNQAMTNAGNQLATQIGNVVSLPIASAPPLAAEVLTDSTKNLTNAAIQYFSGRITQEENRAAQQVLAGMRRSMLTIESSGRPSGASEAALREFGQAAPRAGDKKINVYLFLAESKQIMDILVKDLKAAGANEEQLTQATNARDRVAKYVTWNVDDINRILSSGGPRLVDDRVRELLQKSENLRQFDRSLRGQLTQPSEPSVPAAPATEPAARKVMPNEEKLREYANQKFGGNVENARKYLKSLGYE